MDPTDVRTRAAIANAHWYSAQYEEAIRSNLQFGSPSSIPHLYYAGAGRAAEAQPLIDEVLKRDANDRGALMSRLLLLARQGNGREALAQLWSPTPEERRSRTFHHNTYHRACLYAMTGDAETAVRWLDETVKNGMPVYPAFERDTCFDRIRTSASFVTFMTSLKPVWEDYQRRME
jgi:hypothetical protein